MVTKVKPKVEAATLLDELASAIADSEPLTARRYMDQKENGVINPIVLAKLLDVRPQMIYNYISKGRFTQEENGAYGTNNTQKITIRLDEANVFAASYSERKSTREAEQQEKIQRELRGE